MGIKVELGDTFINIIILQYYNELLMLCYYYYNITKGIIP